MVGCFRSARKKNCESPPKTATTTMETSIPIDLETPKIKTNEEILMRIPGATLHLMEEGETTELAKGQLTIVRLTQENVVIANLIKICTDLQWPLTKDEPVIKVDQLHYLFSLPSDDGNFLNYGVSFSKPNSSLATLDAFLVENSCFSSPNSINNSTTTAAAAKKPLESPGAYWKDFAPRIDDYNGILAKAIAGGTGEIIKGIFKCSNVYSNQVQKGGEMLRAGTEEHTNRPFADRSKRKGSNPDKQNRGIQKSVERVRKLSNLTEQMSKSLLDGVVFATGSVAKPLIRSQAGKAFLNTVPDELLLVSLDALDKIVDALEVAQRQALSATSGAVTGAVSQRFGESAGKVTEDVLATAGHTVGTAWNIFKIRKAVNPASSLPSTALKNAVRKKP